MNEHPYVPGWRLNKENNKPAIKHSVLMLTKHGIAEGEWEGNEWVQYRWSCKVKDSDVLYWMQLEDLNQLEKVGQSFHQEQISLPYNLDEAANDYSLNIRTGYPRIMDETDKYIYNAFKAGAGFAVQRIISLIESRIAEILGNAQPAPILRAELQELIGKIKEGSK